MRVIQQVCWILILAVSFAACHNHMPDPGVQSRQEAVKNDLPIRAETSDSSLNRWLGKWIGPEGTFLDLSKDGSKFVVKINSLDGPAIYEGTVVGDHIEFQRNGKTELIRAGNGQDTGMKWLLNEKNCIFIKKGEGFCR